MTTGHTLTHHDANSLTLIRHPNQWVREGWQMARREHDAVFDSINGIYGLDRLPIRWG